MRPSCLFIHWCQTHRPSSPKCQGTLSISLFWTSKMHFSVFPYIQTLITFLPLSGGTLTPWRLPSIPQGFWDSPYLFGSALARKLRELSLEKGTLLQYVDDLLSSETKQDSDQNTVRVLNFLAQRGYIVSPIKAQISQQRVDCLGFILTQAYEHWPETEKQQ